MSWRTFELWCEVLEQMEEKILQAQDWPRFG